MTTGTGLGHYLSYGIGQIGNQIMRDVPGAMLLFYMTNGLAIPPARAGLAILLPKLWIMAADPAVGLVSDRTRSRWGPRKPYMLGGAIVAGLSFLLLFTLPMPPDTTLATILIGLLYWLMSTAFSFFSVPYLTLAADLGDTADERTKLLAFRQFFGLGGVLAGLALAPWLLAARGGSLAGYALVGLVLGAILLVSTLITTWLVPVRHQRTAAAAANPFAHIAGIFRHRPFRIVFLASAAQLFGFGFHSSGLMYFAVYFLKAPLPVVSSFILTSVLGAAIAQPIWVALARRLGTIDAYRLATLSYAVAHAICAALPQGASTGFIALGLVSGFATCGLTLMSFAMLVETIGLDGEDSPRKALFASAYTAMEKGMLASGGYAVALTLAAFGFVQGGAVAVQPLAVGTAALAAYVAGPVVMMLVSLVILARYRRSALPAAAILSDT